MQIVEQYWDGVVRRLQLEADVFNRLIEHHGEAGAANEDSIANVVRRLLPPTVGVGSGIVIDSDNARSKQCDMIIFDQGVQPRLLAQTTQALFPVETVLLVVEVKTTVTTDEIDDACEKAESVRRLKPVEGLLPEFAFFGFSCSGAPASIVKHARDVERRPDFGCIIRPGIHWTNIPEKRTGFTPLHRRDAADEPVSGAWLPHDALPSDKDAKISYPGFSERAYGRQLLAGDPGRALLLFCREILRALTRVKGSPEPWLTSYLSGTALELLEVK